MNEKENTGQARLLSTVINNGLCTGCGACVELCPYMKTHNAKTIALFSCDLDTGRCFRYCPRAPTDFKDLKQQLFDKTDLTDELGAFKGLYITRAMNPKTQEKAQHGGTVTALVQLAMEEGMVKACVLTGQNENMVPGSFTAFDPSQILAAAGSKFGNAPVVEEFNRISAKRTDNISVVATPCQARALAKMRANPGIGDEDRMSQLKLVIGLFCGWTLDFKKLNHIVRQEVGDEKIIAMDIPPSKYACMEVTTAHGIKKISIEAINDCARQSCDYCTDMTAEFADISVGSARSKDGWDIDRHWNQVIVRSDTGEKLLELAREKGILEFKEVPGENITRLKAASLGKRIYGLKMLTQLQKNMDVQEAGQCR